MSASPNLHDEGLRRAEAGAPPVDAADLTWRSVATVRGAVRSVRVQPWAGVATVQLQLYDDTGGVVVVFTGRRDLPGIALGTELEVTGRVGDRNGAFCLVNPAYRILPRAVHGG